MKKFGYTFIFSILSIFVFSTVEVKADGYWTEGYWDDVNQVWIEGYWTETAPSGYWVEGYWDEATQTWYEGYWVETGTSNPNYQTPSYTMAPKNFTWYNQYANPYIWIGSGNMKDNGCMPTSAAMLLSGYGIYVSPTDLGYYLYGMGTYNNWYGHGASDTAWFDIAAYAGIGAWAVYDVDSLSSALLGGATIGANIIYGNGTHSVLATGYDNGITTIYDPIGGIYTMNVSDLWNKQSWYWVDRLSGSPFIALQ